MYPEALYSFITIVLIFLFQSSNGANQIPLDTDTSAGGKLNPDDFGEKPDGPETASHLYPEMSITDRDDDDDFPDASSYSPDEEYDGPTGEQPQV